MADPARVLLSTSVCPLPAPAAAVLERCQELAEGVAGLAFDPRLSSTVRDELLTLARAEHLACFELGHPAGAGTGSLPSPGSRDRAERLAARRALEETLVCAHRHGVRRVLLPPASLPLLPERSSLARRFARGEALGLEAIDQARAALAPAALDAECTVLEPCLRVAEALDLRLAIPWPAPWPHAFPDASELERLLAIFEGAPLAGCLCLDWAAVHRTLRGSEAAASLPALLTPARLASLRVADACGLSQRLPLGAGEGGWRELLAELGEGELADRVLSFRPDTTAAEVARSLELLGR
jgi:hypothetical protein